MPGRPPGRPPEAAIPPATTEPPLAPFASPAPPADIGARTDCRERGKLNVYKLQEFASRRVYYFICIFSVFFLLLSLFILLFVLALANSNRGVVWNDSGNCTCKKWGRFETVETERVQVGAERQTWSRIISETTELPIKFIICQQRPEQTLESASKQ